MRFKMTEELQTSIDTIIGFRVTISASYANSLPFNFAETEVDASEVGVRIFIKEAL